MGVIPLLSEWRPGKKHWRGGSPEEGPTTAGEVNGGARTPASGSGHRSRGGSLHVVQVPLREVHPPFSWWIRGFRRGGADGVRVPGGVSYGSAPSVWIRRSRRRLEPLSCGEGGGVHGQWHGGLEWWLGGGREWRWGGAMFREEGGD